MASPNDIDESRLKELQISFSNCELDDEGEGEVDAPDFTSSGIAEHKDDKLTQSQLLKRMLEAEERDNRMQRRHETETPQQSEAPGLNDARLFSSVN